MSLNKTKQNKQSNEKDKSSECALAVAVPLAKVLTQNLLARS